RFDVAHFWGIAAMFERKSFGRWLVLPIAVLCFSQSSVRADVTLDLTDHAGMAGTVQGLATDFFTTTNIQATGSGVIDPFVRLNAGGGSAIERGYNTSARPLQFDENSSATFTHDLSLSAIPVVTINGVAYREFLLDINQTGSNPLLTLQELQIFKTNTVGIT